MAEPLEIRAALMGVPSGRGLSGGTDFFRDNGALPCYNKSNDSVKED